MIGAIAGDIIGSRFEFAYTKDYDFPLFTKRSRFTDDTVLTVAVADCLSNKKKYDLTLWGYAREHRGRGYGTMFLNWARSDYPKPYNSFGNGSAMRVSPVGWYHNNIQDVLDEAKKSAEVTHNHPEGIKGAQAVAAAIFLAKNGATKDDIKDYIVLNFHYNLDRTLDEIRPHYRFDVTCQGSVPESIIAFLESNSYEDAVRKAVSLGGDSDTMACITGGIAEAYYKDIPKYIIDEARKRLTPDLLVVVDAFEAKYNALEKENINNQVESLKA